MSFKTRILVFAIVTLVYVACASFALLLMKSEPFLVGALMAVTLILVATVIYALIALFVFSASSERI